MPGAGRRTPRRRESTSPCARSILARTSRAMASGRSRSTSGSGCRTSSSPRSPTARVRTSSTRRTSTTRRSTSSSTRPRRRSTRTSAPRSSTRCNRSSIERGGYIIWSFQNSVDAYSKKVGGIQPVDKTAWGSNRCQLHKLYFRVDRAEPVDWTRWPRGQRSPTPEALLEPPGPVASGDTVARTATLMWIAPASASQHSRALRRLGSRLRRNAGAPGRPGGADPRPRRLPEQLAALRQQLGLDQPLLEPVRSLARQLLTGSLGAVAHLATVGWRRCCSTAVSRPWRSSSPRRSSRSRSQSSSASIGRGAP